MYLYDIYSTDYLTFDNFLSGGLPPKSHQRIQEIRKKSRPFRHNDYKMETGNSYFNLNSLEWPKLESRRLENKLNLFQKARLNLVDIPTDHLNIRQTSTRRDSGGPT